MNLEKNIKISAIIAEYNPFHNGHKLHIEETKKISDYVIVILSGDYIQRGEPAIYNKYQRANMALLNGADLVIELPTVYALSSAEYFSKGSIDIINSLNVVDYLSFGSENGSISELKSIADKLIDSENNQNSLLKDLLKEGYSYPTAVAKALNLNADIINNPNNILAIEYLKALEKTDSNVIPITIKRADNGYNNTSLSSNSFTSATSIRNAINENKKINAFIPDNIHRLFDQKTINNNDFSSIMYYALLSKAPEGFNKYLDVNTEISDKIIKYLPDYKDLSSFEELLKSKNITRSRINRCLFHILLDIKKEDVNLTPSYARILGFKKSSQTVLSLIKEKSNIDLISKLSDAKKCPLLDKDIYAASIYENIAKTYNNEYRTSPVII